MGNIYTTHPHVSLADELVSFVKNQIDLNNPFAICDVTIYVPSPRLARTVRQAFVDVESSGVLLPKVLPFSFAEEEGEDLQFQSESLNFSPSGKRVISSLSRLMLLARWVSAREDLDSFAQSLQGAEALAKLFSRLTSYDISLEDLHESVPPELASHWEKNLDFLKIALEQYPNWLIENDAIDGAQLSREVLLAQADLYQNTGVENLTIAAGFADTTPAGVHVLKALVEKKNGVLILPGLDRGMDEEVWQTLPPTHPQYTLFQLLKKLDIEREDVQTLGEKKVSPRAHMWRLALMPPQGALPEELRSQIPPQALAGLSWMVAENAQEEAEGIALMMRESLEGSGKKCALVSPDRTLAQRVASSLKRWGIEVNDSAGIPLKHTSLGHFFHLLVDLPNQQFRALKVAEMVKHPFCQFGESKQHWKKLASALEKIVLRGRSFGLGLESLKQKKEAYEGSETAAERASIALQYIENSYDFDMEGKRSLAYWVQWHVELATTVIGHEDWIQTDAGEVLISLLENWQNSMMEAGLMRLKDYVDALGNLMEQAPVRPRHSLHPRLFIWGPLEARLQTVDRVILGGVVEGNWPRKSAPDPWLNRAMANQLGLPDPDVSAGLNAHDFVTLASLDEVCITYAKRDGSGDVVPSRFLSRLGALLDDEALHHLRNRGDIWLGRLRQMRKMSEQVEIVPARMNVPLKSRPQNWSASLIRDLMQCPYKAMANKVLKLKKWDDYEQQADASDRGSLIHTCLEAFFKKTENLPDPYKGDWLKEPMLAHLLYIGKFVFAAIDGQSVRAVWWQKFEGIADQFVDEMLRLHKSGRSVACVEKNAEFSITPSIKVKARADRVDEVGGSSVVIDYKTGAPPSATDVLSGQEPQMGVEAMLASRGAYATGCDIAGLEYWHLSGGVKVKQAAGAKKDVNELAAEAYEGLKNLANHFSQTETNYPALPASASALKKEGICRLCDYAGVCRYRDWGAKS